MKKVMKTILSVCLVLTLVASVALLAGCGNSGSAEKAADTAAKVTVPDVVGMSQADAEKAITDAGLTMVVRYSRFSNTTEEGAIDKMLTAAGEEVEKGAEVTVVTSQGKGVVVPNMGPLTGREAQNLCSKVGLTPVMVEEFSDDVPEGNVIGYTDGGQTLPVGSEVTITVSKGPQS